MKKDLLDKIITKITKIFRKYYNKIMELFGAEPSPLYNTTVILIDKSFIDTDFKMDVLKLFVRKKTKQECVYDLSKYKYIHSLNKIKNSYIEDSLFPQNIYQEILKNKHRYAVCVFDTDWIGNEKFDDMVYELDLDDNNVFINKSNKKIDEKSLMYLDNLSGLFGTRMVDYDNFFDELDTIL